MYITRKFLKDQFDINLPESVDIDKSKMSSVDAVISHLESLARESVPPQQNQIDKSKMSSVDTVVGYLGSWVRTPTTTRQNQLATAIGLLRIKQREIDEEIRKVDAKIQQQANQERIDHEIKTVVVGNSGVGKSSALFSYCEGYFPPGWWVIPVEPYVASMQINGDEFEVSFEEASGQPGYRPIREIAYRSTNVFLLMYSCDDPASFNQVRSWVEELRANGRENIPIVLVATKTDLRDDPAKRLIGYHEGYALAKEIGAVDFLEISALKERNLKKTFERTLQIGVSKKAKNVYKVGMFPAATFVSPVKMPVPARTQPLSPELVPLSDVLSVFKAKSNKDNDAKKHVGDTLQNFLDICAGLNTSLAVSQLSNQLGLIKDIFTKNEYRAVFTQAGYELGDVIAMVSDLARLQRIHLKDHAIEGLDSNKRDTCITRLEKLEGELTLDKTKTLEKRKDLAPTLKK